MAFSKSGIIVYNLAEVIEAAKKASNDWGGDVLKEIRAAINPIRDEARDKFEQLGGTGPRTAKSVRTFTSVKQGAGVRMGGARYPYALGREFGAKRNATRPIYRRGRRDSAGQSTSTFVVRRIPYSKASIFGLWTGNQFELGETGGRLTLQQVSGNAFYPAIGAGAQNVFDALAKSTDNVMALFPGSVANTQLAQGGASRLAKLTNLLKQGGINI